MINSPPSTPLVVDNLTFKYRSRDEPAIHAISFSAHAGEMLLIAGASGSGKTTLARCINGLIPRSYKGNLSGRILIQGHDIHDWPLARISQKIGTVLQDPERQILGTKVESEVAFGLENLGLSRPEIRQRVGQALQTLGIEHLVTRETFNLSGGEKQKVALAGVLAMRPSILLLDEPLASLDPASAQETLQALRKLADEGLTILLVEHRVEDVLRYNPDRIMFLQDGAIRYLGPVDRLDEEVDYREVKLPAAVILKEAARDPAPDLPPKVLLAGQNLSGGEQPPIQFEDVSFGYEPDVPILQNINLEIRAGDIVAILGANAAGKTTLVKQAIGLLKPRHGRVLINGKDTRQMSVAEVAGSLGYVFQSPSHMLFAPTVREELGFGPANLHHSPQDIEKQVSEAIRIVNLAGLEDFPPLALSFGQQKRVSIAAILAMRSKILVMDEPTAGQDYQNYRSFMNSILKLPGFEAILFITHDIDMAVIYANRVVLVNDGRIAADGPPEQVLADFDLLRACRLVPTSLLELNLKYLHETGGFSSAEALAHEINNSS